MDLFVLLDSCFPGTCWADVARIFFSFADDNKIQWGSCGLSGELRVNVTFPGGDSCDATLGDWNPRMCQARSKLVLAPDPSCSLQRRHGKGGRGLGAEEGVGRGERVAEGRSGEGEREGARPVLSASVWTRYRDEEGWVEWGVNYLDVCVREREREREREGQDRRQRQRRDRREIEREERVGGWVGERAGRE